MPSISDLDGLARRLGFKYHGIVVGVRMEADSVFRDRKIQSSPQRRRGRRESTGEILLWAAQRAL